MAKSPAFAACGGALRGEAAERLARMEERLQGLLGGK
jgi:hypothetical protein